MGLFENACIYVHTQIHMYACKQAEKKASLILSFLADFLLGVYAKAAVVQDFQLENYNFWHFFQQDYSIRFLNLIFSYKDLFIYHSCPTLHFGFCFQRDCGIQFSNYYFGIGLWYVFPVQQGLPKGFSHIIFNGGFKILSGFSFKMSEG